MILLVTNATGKTLPEISGTVRDLALRARDGKLQLNEFQVITISLYSSKDDTSTSIVNI